MVALLTYVLLATLLRGHVRCSDDDKYLTEVKSSGNKNHSSILRPQVPSGGLSDAPKMKGH